MPTYPLTMPTGADRAPAAIRYTPIKADGQTVDPFSFTTQSFEFPGERWSAEVAIPSPIPREIGNIWIAFLAGLNGKIGSFNLKDPSARTLGTASGTVTASGAARSKTVSLSGTGTFKAGDWITLNSRYLHMILADGTLGGSFDIWPALRTAASGNVAYGVNAYGRFVLEEPPSWQSIPGDMIEFTPFVVIEDMRP